MKQQLPLLRDQMGGCGFSSQVMGLTGTHLKNMQSVEIDIYQRRKTTWKTQSQAIFLAIIFRLQ